MDTKVKEFLEAAKSKEREAFEKERDKHLISLGLIKEGESIREYSDRYVYPFTLWDKEKQKYYYDKKVPINVTDDEYEEIKKYSTKEVVEETTKLNKGAEKFLGGNKWDQPRSRYNHNDWSYLRGYNLISE